MSIHKLAHERALILLDAERAVPGITFDEDATDMDIRRSVVARVLGRNFVDGRRDDYVIGCFQIISEEGRVAKPAPTHYPPVGRPRYH